MTNLYKHQTEALALCTKGNHALFHECGTGKTLTMLEAIRAFKAQGLGPALVVCPLSIIEPAWIADCTRFTPDLSIVSLWDSKPAERVKRLGQQSDIYVCNYETLKILYPHICKKGFKILVVDESSKMKEPKSQITKCLLSFAGIRFRGSPFKAECVIPHRYCLSGTPAPNLEDEYWSQIKFITGPGGKVFNDNYYAFRSYYFHGIPLGMTGQRMWKFREYMRNEFMTAMRPVTHVVRKEDALDLPEQVHEVRKVYLGKEEQKAYDTMKKDLILYYKDEVIVASSALVEIMKLRQLTSGFAYYTEGEAHIGDSKLKELKQLLGEIGKEQVIIWVNFKSEIQTLLKELPSSRALWSGTEDRNNDIADFQSGKFQYFVIHPQSGGHGLTFAGCHYAVYYSLCYSYELLKQSQDRIHRIGQKNKCTYYYLIADKTIDEVVHKTLTSKEKLSNMVLDFLKGGE